MSYIVETSPVDLGEVSEGSKTNLRFTTEESSPRIDSIKTSCGCTDAVINRKTNNFRVKYVAPTFPKHLIGKTEFLAKKITVKVTFTDDTVEVVKIKAKVIR